MQQPSQSYAVRNDVTLVVRVYESLWKACLSQRAVSAKDSLKDRKGDNTKLKSQKTVTEWTAWGFLWPSLVWRCSPLLGKQIRFFMCRDPFFAQKMKLPCLALIFFFALVFSRLERGPDPLFLTRSPMILNWVLNPHTHFEPTFSTSDTFQVQILTEIYDKRRVYAMLKAEFKFFLVDFVPFEFSYWSASRRRHNQETTWLVTCAAVFFLRSFFKKTCYG